MERQVDLKLNTLKPPHAKWVTSFYDYIQYYHNIVVNGWKRAGIIDFLEDLSESKMTHSGRYCNLDHQLYSFFVFFLTNHGLLNYYLILYWSRPLMRDGGVCVGEGGGGVSRGA